MSYHAEQKPESGFEEEIKLFDREFQLIKEDFKLSTSEKIAKLTPLFPFLGGDETTKNISEEIDLLERYAKLTIYYFSFFAFTSAEYEEFSEGYNKNIGSLRQENDWGSQCELMIKMYEQLQGVFKSKVDALKFMKERSLSETGYSFDEGDEIELETFSVPLRRIELALSRLRWYLNEAKREEQKRGYSP